MLGPSLRPNPLKALLVALLLAIGACNGENGAEGPDAGDADIQDNTNQPQQECTPGATRCAHSMAVETCDEEGQSWVETTCDGGEQCDAELGACTAEICSPGTFDSCTDDGLQRYCNVTGTAWVEGACPGGGPCEGGQCPNPECEPGVDRCVARDTIETCNAAGAYVPSSTCPSGTECFEAVCEELCEISSKVSSYMGCEYWSVDLDNFEGALSQPHAIILTNPSDELPAEVQIFEGFTNIQVTIDSEGQPFATQIPPGEARIFSIPVGYDHSGTQIFHHKALRITSTIPVVAHQFNPLNNVDVFSNDGTLLLPTNTLGTEYYGLSWIHRGGTIRIRGYLTVVNSSGTDNTITVRPSANVVAGPDIPAITAGEERTFELPPGSSLNLSTAGTELDDAFDTGCLSDPEGHPTQTNPCPDLTGTHITSVHPITVFGGHQCANVLPGVDRCDHIESILLPVKAWGTSYVGSKFSPRATGALIEPDFFRVIAAENSTRIQTDPPIDGVHNRTIQAGEWLQFPAREHFEIAADRPIQVAQYMVGANWLGIERVCADGSANVGIGDPAMAIAVPTDQFRDHYIVHTPLDYEEDYLNVIVPVGVDVTLNGEPIPASAYRTVGSMNRFEVATVTVQPGFHTLQSDTPFGVVSYGYDCRVSYATPGGLNLEPRE